MPWSRLDNVPQFFPTKISLLIADQSLDVGDCEFMNNGVKLIGLTNNSNYIADSSAINSKIFHMDYSKVNNVSSYFNANTSMFIVDNNLDFGSNFLPKSFVVPVNNNDLLNKL